LAANVGRNHQFEHGDIGKRQSVFFRLDCASIRTEIPLLTHDLLKCLTVIYRPAQDILLRPYDCGFQKTELNFMNIVRLFKKQPNRLRSRFTGPPAMPPVG